MIANSLGMLSIIILFAIFSIPLIFQVVASATIEMQSGASKILLNILPIIFLLGILGIAILLGYFGLYRSGIIDDSEEYDYSFSPSPHKQTHKQTYEEYVAERIKVERMMS